MAPKYPEKKLTRRIGAGRGKMAKSASGETIAGRAGRLAFIAAFSLIVALAGLTSLPPLDRDESRFAQASAQMLESGDFITIRFQEAERNKKPAGIYWLQAASVSAFSSVEAREIWAYRLPSVLGAILAAMFTYLAGARLFGPSTGFLAALLLAASPALAGEASIAKTDAFLLATITIAEAAFIHIFARSKDGARAGWAWPVALWIALGAGILVKGPIAPLVVGLTGLAMLFREPKIGWVKAMRPVTGLIILILMVGPWAIAIDRATEGRFFADAIGADMAAKVGQAQESHAGPPGYYIVLLWALFWPAAALIIPGMARAIAARRAWSDWLLLGWLIPAWIIFEATATKLPHYTLPLYPALAIIAARAAAEGASLRRKLARRFGAGVYALIGLAFAGLVAALPHIFSASPLTPVCYAAAALIAAASLLIAFFFLQGRAYQGGLAAAFLAAFVAWTVLGGVLPRLDRLMISPHLSSALDEAGYHPLRDGAPAPALAGYAEPSAVFLIGTQTILTDGEGAAARLEEAPEAAVAVEARLEDDFRKALAERSIMVAPLAVIEGLNYSKGRDIHLTVYARKDR